LKIADTVAERKLNLDIGT